MATWKSTFVHARDTTLARLRKHSASPDEIARAEEAFRRADPVAAETRQAVLTEPEPSVVGSLKRAVRRHILRRSERVALWACARASKADRSPFVLYCGQVRVSTGQDRNKLIRSIDPDAVIEE